MRILIAFIASLVLVCPGLVYAQVEHTLFLIGDAGEPFYDSPVGTVLREKIAQTRNPSTVLFLGDNIYPRGMPPKGSGTRVEAESIVMMQVGWVRDTGARAIFIPGNHDWKKGAREGFATVLRQQRFIDSLRDDRISFLPRDGCPGPEVLELTEKVVLVIIDSQWPLHPWKNATEEESPCEAKTEADLAAALSDVYARYYDRRVILAAHHPVVTYGEHGGVFSLKEHIFPLTSANPNLYIPLPVIGSLYPTYRAWFGNVQDLAHPLYRAYASQVMGIMSDYPGSVMVAGHDHALQYATIGKNHFIVSGAGSKTSYVKKKGHALYAESVTGFVQLDLMHDGSAVVTFWRVDNDHPQGLEAYRDTIAPIPTVEAETAVGDQSFPDSVVIRASAKYAANAWRQRMLGENYRAEWGQTIKVPVFDIGKEKGGLEPVKMGGGMQTVSLRLRDSVGREYTLRSIEKYPEAAVPEPLRKTFAQDLVEDQISAAHPYAALVVPPMAEAVGVYHTNPKLVYIPDDPRLGVYRKKFANMLALFEERPDEDWSHEPSFGKSKNIIGTSRLLEKLRKDNDNFVDEKQVLRSRLFDLVIGDWDRHDDQWRWAEFKDGKRTFYQPIPRDRDQTFFVNQGILPRLWSRKWAMPKFEGFDEEIDWAPGLAFNARHFDRSFLTSLTQDDWIQAVREIQQGLTDSVIVNSIRQWPPEIYAIRGEEIIRKLKARRDNLMDAALELYRFLAREVDVVGSDKHEVFDVVRQPDGNVVVDVYKSNKEGELRQQMYHRVFRPAETKEIRLYGMGGIDRFDIRGEAESSIKIRVIGGEDMDTLRDVSTVGAPGSRTIFYDTPASSFLQSSGNVRDRRENDPRVNEYDRMAFRYDRLAPLIYGNFNPDDGLFIGGGVLYQNHGFRKEPFKQRHIALASIAPRTSSYNLLYRGIFTGVTGKWNLEAAADIKAPNFVNNFFGWGNESVFDDNIDEQPGINVDDAIDYYRFRFEEIRLSALLTRPIGNYTELKIGPTYQRIELEGSDGEDRYVFDYAETLPYDIFERYNSFAGLQFELESANRDNDIVTKRGLHARLAGRAMQAVSEGDGFTSLDGSVALYHTFRYPGRLIFAVRTGGGINTGTYPFYQAQVLDGRTEIRGFRKTRFYGDSRFYTNLEMRLQLTSLRTYLFPVSLGILGFHDFGRVWYENEEGIDPTAPSGRSDVWHRTWGGGIWMTPFNLTVLSAELGHSPEGNLFYLRLGFLF
jgi:hypothetical protein